jgi:hypothetical protein
MIGWSNMDENLHDMTVTDMTPYGMNVVTYGKKRYNKLNL